MGSVFFSGQTIRYVGDTRLTVSDTKLSAAANVNRMFAGENVNDAALIVYIPGLPDFLQGWTQFVPGSSYLVFARGVSSLPINLSPGDNWIPPISSTQETLAGKLYSGVSFFVSTTAGEANVFTGESMEPTAFNRLSAENVTNRIFQVRPIDDSIAVTYDVYVPGLPEFLQGFTTFKQASSYITFFQQQAVSAGSVLGGFLPLELYKPAVTPTQTPTRTTTRTATQTKTTTQTPTNTRTLTQTRTPTQTKTRTQTPTRSQTPTTTVSPTQTPTETRTPTRTKTQTPTATNTRTKTQTQTPKKHSNIPL